MIKLIDTHAHYDDEAFDSDRDELLQGLFEQSVSKIITVGCSVDRWQPTIELTEKYSGMYGALGIHPEDICNLPEDYIDRLRELAALPKIKAIGEAGLDYRYEGFDRERQTEVFRSQIQLADELSMPLIIHSRDSTEDTLKILRETKPKKAVVHCFSGSAETAAELTDMGLYISFTGVLTFKNSKRAAAACEAVPIDRIMLETDCPYMAPVPYRGKRCDSSMITETAARLGEIKGMTAETVIEVCNENAERFFGMNSLY